MTDRRDILVCTVTLEFPDNESAEVVDWRATFLVAAIVERLDDGMAGGQHTVELHDGSMWKPEPDKPLAEWRDKAGHWFIRVNRGDRPGAFRVENGRCDGELFTSITIDCGTDEEAIAWGQGQASAFGTRMFRVTP
jgi:hypothetical protein